MFDELFSGELLKCLPKFRVQSGVVRPCRRLVDWGGGGDVNEAREE